MACPQLPAAHYLFNNACLHFLRLFTFIRYKFQAELLQQENTKLLEENRTLTDKCDALTAELSVLDPAFFDEVEDLKFALKQANSRIERYEALLGDSKAETRDRLNFT